MGTATASKLHGLAIPQTLSRQSYSLTGWYYLPILPTRARHYQKKQPVRVGVSVAGFSSSNGLPGHPPYTLHSGGLRHGSTNMAQNFGLLLSFIVTPWIIAKGFIWKCNGFLVV